MRRRPTISFCMVTWNRAPMLERCLKSFFEKISGEISFEMIVWNNASTDDTNQVLERFKDNQNIRIVHSKVNLRLNAYKPLFGLARGKYMVDLDDDVIEFPQDFDKTIVEYFDAFPDYGFIGLNVVQNDKTTGNKPGRECYHDDTRDGKTIEEGPVGGWCAAFRRRHYLLFKFFFNRLELSIKRVEDGVLSGFLHTILRRRQGVIKEAVCLHATGAQYAREFGLLDREYEKYSCVGMSREACLFKE